MSRLGALVVFAFDNRTSDPEMQFFVFSRQAELCRPAGRARNKASIASRQAGRVVGANLAKTICCANSATAPDQKLGHPRKKEKPRALSQVSHLHVVL